MADLAGAIAAIKDRFADGWKIADAPRTRIAQVNEVPTDPWPPKIGDILQPWILLEVDCRTTDRIVFGSPGHVGYQYLGTIQLHSFVPTGTGAATALQNACDAGEIFRNALFYDNVTPGCFVRSFVPSIGRGQEGDDVGAWFRVTASIPFEYWHRA